MTPTESRRLPMFPLGTLVFPGSVIPLHVFEPRYQRLTSDCLAADRSFGIVLISRGAEVGGGDQRTDIGTLVVITKAASLGEGRWLMVAHGQQRIRVTEWLEDDPYPQAMVVEWPDPAAEVVEPSMLAHAVGAVRRTRALLSETQASPALSADVTFDDDPVTACWQLCGEAPLNAYDAQRLLEIEGTAERLALLIELISELEDDLHRLLAQ
jgi:Lon protease-like protein